MRGNATYVRDMMSRYAREGEGEVRSPSETTTKPPHCTCLRATALLSLEQDWDAAVALWTVQHEKRKSAQQQLYDAERDLARRRHSECRAVHEAKTRRLEADLRAWENEIRAESAAADDETASAAAAAMPAVSSDCGSSHGEKPGTPKGSCSSTGAHATAASLFFFGHCSSSASQHGAVRLEDMEDVPRSALPSHVYPTYLAARGKHEQKFFGEAVQLLGSVLEQLGNDKSVGELFGNIAACHYCLGNYNACLQNSIVATQLNPSHAVNYARAARSSLALVKVGDARRYIKQLENLPRSPLYDVEREEQAADAVDRYTTALSHGRYEGAVTALTTANTLLPCLLPLEVLRVEALAHFRPEEALEEVTAMLGIHPNCADLLYWKGQLTYRQCFDPVRVNGCQQWLLRAIGCSQGNNHPRAMKLMHLLKQLETQRSIATSLVQTKRWKQAISVYGYILSLDLQNVKLTAHFLRLRAKAHLASGDYDASIGDATSALNTDNSSSAASECLGIRADASFAMKLFEKAIKDAEGAYAAEATQEAFDRLAGFRREYASFRCHASSSSSGNAGSGPTGSTGSHHSDPFGSADGQDGQPRKPRRPQSATVRPPAKAEATLYDALGIARDAEHAKIARAFRDGALRWHPDKWATGTPAEKAAAEARFKEINHAYSVLSDEASRRKYELTLPV